MTKIVFDIGGTSMRVARVDGDKLSDIKKVSTPDNPNTAIDTLVNLAKEISGGEVEKVVGGIPGILEKNGKIFRLPNLPEWKNFDLVGKLKEKLCQDINIENDSALAALGEAVYGAGKSYSIVGYIGIGTGLGGAKVVDKKIDAHKYGFEPGHDVIDASNGTTLSDNVSGHALQQKYGKRPSDLDSEVYDKMTPLLALGLYNTTLLWAPDVLVLGGSLINGVNGFKIPDIIIEMKKANTTLPELPEVRKSELGDTAGLHGAMALMK